jgi:carboxymethylenebutenolidase
MPSVRTEIRTDDGVCPTHIFTQAGAGPKPGVILYMDGVGIRPALMQLAQRLADGGYVVMLPDLFYRAGNVGPADVNKIFSDLEYRADWQKKVMMSAVVPNVMSDTKALLDFLSDQSYVRQSRVGTTGYCMGARMSLSAAGNYPNRIAAAAAYHGGGLATAAADSPHRLASKMKAKIYVGGATGDAGFDDDQKKRLDAALTKAGVEHTIETYPAKHGWVLTDTPVYDAVCAERHWETLFALFKNSL